MQDPRNRFIKKPADGILPLPAPAPVPADPKKPVAAQPPPVANPAAPAQRLPTQVVTAPPPAAPDPLAIRGARPPAGLAPGAIGYQANVGPPAPVPAPAPVNPPGPARVMFNPIATELQAAGALRPAASPTEVVPWSRDNPQPMKDGAGRLLPPAPAAAIPVSPPRPGAPPTAASPMAMPAQAQPATPAPTTPPRPAVQTLPTQTVIAPPATPASGRPGIGITPTGIPGISEVTGNPDGSRTFTDNPDGTAAALGTRGTLRNPNAVPTAERDAYLNTVPTLGSGPTVSRPSVGPQGGGGISPVLAARFAQSQALAVANEDTRSASGNAARNARIRLENGGAQTKTQREAAAAAYQAQINGLLGPSNAAAGAAAEQRKAETIDAGATQRAGIEADASRANAIVSRPRGSSQSLTLEDGSLAQLGEDGTLSPVIGADGKPARTLQKKEDPNTARTAAVMDDLASKAAESLKNSVPYGTKATPEAIQAARLEAAQIKGLQTAANPDTGEMLININGEWVPL